METLATLNEKLKAKGFIYTKSHLPSEIGFIRRFDFKHLKFEVQVITTTINNKYKFSANGQEFANDNLFGLFDGFEFNTFEELEFVIDRTRMGAYLDIISQLPVPQ